MASVALSVLVIVGDLNTAGQLAGVLGAVVGAAALIFSVHTMTRAPQSPSPQSAPQVRATGGSNAALGSIRNAQARDTSATPVPPDTGDGVVAANGSNASGGDIDGATAHRGQ
ncbi:hypothetical protein AB0D13_23445 [Streptomyces sp. NPDC048430]|uniref:hypothetical protein n=1 Tax=Streptomyces sp. NPDC048430 TaxID=3155388 RepID=UPI0034203845